jgi:hypothetical protein
MGRNTPVITSHWMIVFVSGFAEISIMAVLTRYAADRGPSKIQAIPRYRLIVFMACG